jgi:hypothetical protein
MPIPIGSIGAVQAADASGISASKTAEKAGATPVTRTEARDSLNASILQASIEVSISSQNEPLALLLKSAISSINDILAPEFGANAIQNAVSQDNTAAGTAGRIVALSTGFYEAFKAQHVGEDSATVLQNFMTTIRGGFEQGFKEASDILQGLGVLNGDIASSIDQTHQLVLQGYADFAAAQGLGPSDNAQGQEIA